MIFLPGYGIRKAIYRNAKTAYYTGERKRDGKPVIIKIPLQAIADDKDLALLSHEHAILTHLDMAGIPKSCGIETCRSGYALIMEAFPGLCLAEINKPRDIHLGDALAVAAKLAEILAGLHEHHLIHNDIKTESIFYDTRFGGRLAFGFQPCLL